MGAKRKPDHAAEARRRQAAAERRAAEPQPARARGPMTIEQWYAEDHADRMAKRQALEDEVVALQDLARLRRALVDVEAQRAALVAERDAAVEHALGLGLSMRRAAAAAGTTRQALLKRRQPAPGAS